MQKDKLIYRTAVATERIGELLGIDVSPSAFPVKGAGSEHLRLYQLEAIVKALEEEGNAGEDFSWITESDVDFLLSNIEEVEGIGPAKRQKIKDNIMAQVYPLESPETALE